MGIIEIMQLLEWVNRISRARHVCAQYLITKLPDPLYLILINLKSTLLGSQFRLVKSVDGRIKVREKHLTWFTHRKRLPLYLDGLDHRGDMIGRSYLLSEVNFQNGDVVVDCGANMGDLLLYFIGKNMSVVYIGVEPNPKDFLCLSLNVESFGDVLNFALWDRSLEMKFFVDSSSASSSLIEPPNYSHIITVDARRLDSIPLPARIKLLKVEGEGAEPEILMGASGVLPRIEFISVDAGPERGINQVSTKNEVTTLLQNFGFELLLENPFHRKTLLFKNLTLI